MVLCLRKFTLLLGWVSISCLLVFGQGFTASILGTVTDNTGAVVPMANVSVTNIGTGQEVLLKTDENGSYQAPLLQPGDYRVAVEVQGFKRAARESVTLQVDQRQRLDFQLEVGQVSENVNVTAEASTVQTDTATVGTVMTQTQTSELPLNGRNFLQLNLLVPGAQESVKGSNLNTQGGSIQVHGIRESSNYFWIDGVDNTSQTIGQYVVQPPIYSIQEFKVMSPTYDAEFGRTAGAQINVITKSGTNSFHGDLYEFLRNSDLDAKNFFDPPGPIPAYRRNQFGVDVGGKIKKDRTFFYVAYEGLRTIVGETASNVVPTPQEITGNFSGLSTPIIDPSTGKPFPGNIIPASRINPIGAAIASYYPAPNAPDQTYLVSPSATQNDDVLVAKLDQIVTPNNRFTIRAAFEDVGINDPISPYAPTTNIPGFGLINHPHYYTTGVSDVQTFSPNLVGELRAGWNRFAFDYVIQDYQDDFLSKTGLGAPFASTQPHDQGLPLIEMSGVYANLGATNSNPEVGPFDTVFVAPTMTWSKGKHTLKFGGDFHHYDSNFSYSQNVRGTYNFSGQFSGDPLADLLLGVPAVASIATNLNGNEQYLGIMKQASAFVQDDWRINRRFTVTAGLRYEYAWPAVDGHNRLANFDPTTGQVIVAGQNGVGDTVYNTSRTNFAPRVGFAWDPHGNGKWAVRGGYGIFYELNLVNEEINLWLNPPFYTNYVVNGNGTTVNLDNVFSGVAPAVPSVDAYTRNFKTGRVQQFSADVQHELASNLLLDIGYVGTRGANLFGTVDDNAPYPGPGSIAARRPYPQFAYIYTITPAFSSEYNGLEVRLEKRFSSGLQFLTSYTFSKSDDDSSSTFTTNDQVQNNHDIGAEWGPSTFDVRHRFVFSSVYQLPFGTGRKYMSNSSRGMQLLFGGWQANGILTLRTGQPWSPLLPIDNSNTGEYTDRPNLVGNPYQSTPGCQVETPNCWANQAAYATPPQYTYGDAGRDSLRGPNLKDLDFSLFKVFELREFAKLEVRAESFNLLNRANFDPPTLNAYLGPTFGRILTAEPPRQIQFGMRLTF
jgi:Carboxypeptidase regulatory-like domain/TonB dependent receptor